MKKGSTSMAECLFFSAEEVAELLGISRAKAYKIVRELNEGLKTAGYITIAGKIPKQLFYDKCYGLVSA